MADNGQTQDQKQHQEQKQEETVNVNGGSRSNPVVTDAVTQANVKVLGDSPAMALSNLYQTISQSLSLSAQNAVTAQQQTNIIHQATTTQGVSLLYSIDTASIGVTTGKINRSDTPDVLANIIGTVEALKQLK